MSNLIQSDHDSGIVRITLNRAPVNALSPEFLMEFAALIDDLGARDDVRAILIDSAFRVFSAGLDLKEAQDFDIPQQQAIVKGLNVGFLSLFSCPKPTVVAASGAAIAGGLFFVLAADYRIATPRAQFGLAEVRVGADFPAGPLEIARATLSPNDLRRLMLTGQQITAEQALRRGIVDALAEPDTIAAEALKAAKVLAGNPPLTYAAIKRQIRGSTIDLIETAMAAGANAPKDGWFNTETTQAMRRMLG